MMKFCSAVLLVTRIKRVGGLVLAVIMFNIPALAALVVFPSDDGFNVVVVRPNSNSSIAPSIPTGFDYVRANERILTGFPIGHNLPKVANQLFYNLELDGYGGLPYGSCLRRGYLLDDEDPDKALCIANENRDLMRVWAGRNPNLKNVLLKNLTIKNAFRTYNVVDGDVVTRSSELPHTDTFQMFYNGDADEDPDWFGIQDTVIKNSDNSLMITGGGRFKGAVYQNLFVTCDAEFVDDDAQRHINDSLEFRPNDTPSENYGCTNSISFHSLQPAVVWLIEIQAGNDGQRGIQILNENAPVIAVGADASQWNVLTRESRGKPLSIHPNIRYYPTIESALETEARPPFIEWSCSGWESTPANCEAQAGYLE